MAGGVERSHYQVLGVSNRASLDEIRRAHRQLARVLHPDRLSGASEAERTLAERRMREVNAAWTVLSDPDRRRTYDLTLVGKGGGAGQRPGNGGGAARSSAGPSTGPATAGPRGTAAAAGGRRPWEDDEPPPRVDEIDPDEEPLPEWHFFLLRRVPVIAALVLAAGIFVFTAYASTGDDTDDPGVGPTTTGLTSPYCVRVFEGRNAVPVDCTGPNDGRLVTQVAKPLDCPAGTRYVVIGGEVHCVDGDAGEPN